QLDQRGVRVVPCREARTVSLRARRGARELHHLPRSPWIEQRSVAGGEAADAVPAPPHRDASPLDDLRQPVDTKPQRPHRRSRLRELSFADPRIESSVGPDVYEVADAHTALFAARALDAGARAPGDGAAGSPAAACALRDGGAR